MKETYYHAEYLVSHHANELGLKLPIKRLYAIGDNPDTDIYGANTYNRYLQNRSLSQLNQVVSQTATSTLTDNLWSLPNAVEVIVNNAEQYYSAESIDSILVCTGVYNRDTYDETSERNYAPRDVVINPELRIPKHTCEHVLDAVKLIFDLEQFH